MDASDAVAPLWAALRANEAIDRGEEPLCGVADQSNGGCNLGVPFEQCTDELCQDQYALFLFPALALAIGVVVKPLEPKIRLPYTLVLLILGILLGVAGCSADMGMLSTTLHRWVHLNPPSAFFFWFLSPLIFEAAFNSDFHVFRKVFLQILTLSNLMIIIQMALVAVFQRYIIREPEEFNWYSALTFGAMLSATDPIAVTATLKTVGAPKQLGTLIEGESLLNDGSAFVLFEAFFHNIAHPDDQLTAFEIFIDVLRLSLGGAAMGLAFGLAAAVILSFTYELIEVEVSMTIVVAFLGFWVAQSPARVSGVICNVTSGLVLSALGKPLISPSVREPLQHFWELLAFIANTIVFVYAGVLVTAFAWSCSGSTIGPRDYLLTFAWFIWLQIIRVGSIFLLYPILRYRQRWWNWRHGVAVGFSGLRGAISLILALKVGLIPSEILSPKVSSRIVFWTCGLVALSLLINGILIKPLLHWLHLDDTNPTREEFVWRAKGAMLQKTFQILDAICVDGLFKTASWPTVKDNVIPAAWINENHSAARAFARMSLEMSYSGDSSVQRFSRSSRASFGGEMFSEYLRKSLDLADLEMRRAEPETLEESNLQYPPRNIAPLESSGGPKSLSSLMESTLDLTVPVRTEGVQGTRLISAQSKDDLSGDDVLDSIDGIYTDENTAPLRRSIVYNTLRRMLNVTNRPTQVAGEDVDIEIRRRYLISLARNVRLAYETSVIEFALLQSMLDDVKTAQDNNEEGEPYTLFAFLNHVSYEKGCCSLGDQLFEKSPIRTRMLILNFVLAAVVESLKETYLKESILVFSEAEQLFEATSLHLNHLESLDQEAFAWMQTDAAIRYVFQKQEEALEAMRRHLIVDEDDFDEIHANLIQAQRHYFLVVSRFSKFPWPTEDEVVEAAPLLGDTPEGTLETAMAMNSARKITLQKNHLIPSVLNPGVVLVLSGGIKVVDSLVGQIDDNADEVNSWDGMDEFDGDDIAVAPRGLGRTSLSLETREHVTMHWCFAKHNLIVHPDVLACSGGGEPSGNGFPRVLGCDVIGGGTILVLTKPKAIELASHNETFRLEVVRAFAHMVALESLNDQRPYVLSHTAELERESVEETPASRASLILRQLPYTDSVVARVGQHVLIQGPGVLVSGRLTLRNPEERVSPGQLQQGLNALSGPCTLPAGSFLAEILPKSEPEDGVDTETLLLQDKVESTELLLVPLETVEQQAIGRTQHWSGARLTANGRYGSHRHVDVIH